MTVVRVDHGVERLLRRDRVIVLALLAVVIAASWAWLLAGAGMGASGLEMTRMAYVDGATTGMVMAPATWSLGYAVVVFFMWWIMMIAMMLPGATPMILLFAVINRNQHESGRTHVPTTFFTASYLLTWGVFSLAATLLHWSIHQAGLLTPGMALHGRWLGAGILIAAGLYQLTSLKQACLHHCRMPAQYLAGRYRPGLRGALALGFRHGAYCLGCCWVLMLLLFFGGVMNLYWIAGLALYVLLEKTIPAGHWLDRALGVALVAAGVWWLIG